MTTPQRSLVSKKIVMRFMAMLMLMLPLMATNQHGQRVLAAVNTLTVNVFQDLDVDSTYDGGESGVDGVTVNLFDSDDPTATACATAVTAGGGIATFDSAATTGCAGDLLRMEVDTTTYPVGMQVGPVNQINDDSDANTPSYADAATDASAAVQLVDLSAAAVTLNIGAVDPTTYTCDASNAYAMTTCFVNGDATHPDATDRLKAMDTLVGFPYTAQGSAFEVSQGGTEWTVANGNVVEPDHLATQEQTGAIWGLAWSQQYEVVYTSAFLKRHIGMGPLGPGGIYSVDFSTGVPMAGNFMDIADPAGLNIDVGQGVIPSNADRGLAYDTPDPSHDVDVYEYIFRASLGDIDLVTDEALDPNVDGWIDREMILVVNLFERDVLFIDTQTQELVMTYDIPAPGSAGVLDQDAAATAACTDGEHRPFAVDYNDGKMYIGMICDGSTLADLDTVQPNAALEVIVYEYDLTVDLGAATIPGAPTVDPVQVLREPLTYRKGAALSGNCYTDNYWMPWRSTALPSHQPSSTRSCWATPILVDIDFADGGNMVLAFSDRSSHQWGWRNYGLDESNTSSLYYNDTSGDLLLACPDVDGNWALESGAVCGVGANQVSAPAGATTNEGPGGGEFFYADTWGSTHLETANAGVAVLPGSGEIIAAGMDPYGNLVHTAGGINWHSTTDGVPRTPGYMLYASPGSSADGDEADMAGTQGKSGGLGDVDLMCPQMPIQIGDYVWFDADKDGIQDPDELPLAGVTVYLRLASGATISTTTDAFGRYYFDASRNQDYVLAFDASTTTTTLPAGVFVEDFVPTAANSAGSTDGNDSDLVGTIDINGKTLPKVDYTSPISGASDHTIDAGFHVGTYDLALVKVISGETPKTVDGIVTYQISVMNQGELPSREFTVVDTLPAGLIYVANSATNAADATTGVDIAVDAAAATTDPAAPGTVTWTLGATHSLEAGESLTLEIQAQLKDLSYVTYRNEAEIATDTGDDIDSFPDTNTANDNDNDQDGGNDGEETRDYTDLADVANTDTNADDEDDHDPAEFIAQIFDLALDKVLTTATTVAPGDTAIFTITVYNQGDTDAYDIDVQDYIPANLTYSATGSTATGDLTTDATATVGFTNNGDGTFTIDELAQDDQVSFDIALTVAADFQGTTLTNWAEISDASDTDGGPTTLDIDSTPDGDNFNQAGETNDLDDDNVVDEDGKNGGDEDDHDPAPLTVTQTFDLALTKVLTSTAPFAPGDAVIFTINVINQGTLDAYDIDIADYIPTGMSYSAAGSTATGDLTTTNAATVGFTNNADGSFTIAELAKGDDVSFNIELSIATDFVGTSLTNWAEISDAAATPDGPTATDVDSTPDDENFNQDGETDDLDDDNVVDEDGKNGGDEDDHDPARITVSRFDLALDKVLATTGTVMQGETVTFTVTVYNQGDVHAYDVDVQDYIPTDMTYSVAGSTATGTVASANAVDTGFTNNDDGTFTIDELAVGDSLSFDIAMTIDPDFQGTQIVNWAEISDASDADGGPTRIDIDSTPDADNFNQDGETNDLDDDNVVDEDGKSGGDEDDHDPAPVTVTQIFDLALTKVLKSEGPFSPGNDVTYTINVINQGTLNAYDIDIADFIPAGMTYANAGEVENWALTSANGATVNLVKQGDGTFSLDSLLHHDDVSFDIALTINQDFGGSTLTNWAEISDASETPGGPTATDIDSTPDAENFNQDGETDDLDDDNVVDEDGKNGGDEDDHDPAIIEVTRFDLALKKTLVTEGQISRGDAVTFAITIYNQGDVDAFDITTVDYVPAGMTFTSSNAADVVTTENDAAVVVTDNADSTFGIDTLAVGDNVTFEITLTLDPSFEGTLVVNWAEISGGSDEPGGEPRTDIDSTPDDDNFNQPEETDDLDDDDVIDEDGKNGGDEDDHDPAPVTVTPLYSLGNQVWEDTNEDGLIDDGEPLLEGIWVELWQDADGDGIADDINADGVIDDSDMLAMDTTDADGLYLFEDLLAGTYLVSIPAVEWVDADGEPGPLAGLVSTPGDDQSDTDNNDNGIDPANPGDDVWSGPVILGDGEPNGENPDNDLITPDNDENLTVDFGFIPTYSLGNQVWLDSNDNGLIDADEDLLEGIWVELWQDADQNGQPDDLNNDGVIDDSDMLAMDTTDADGLYLFDYLPKGSYVVSIPAVEWVEADGSAGPLAGHRSSTGALNDDADNNDNGIDPANIGEDVFSASIALGDGEPTLENPDNDAITRDENENLTVDFGFVPVYSLGNQVWEDSNNNGIIDEGEPLLENIWVELWQDADGDGVADDLNADGVIDDADMLAMDTTDENGFYLFDELDAGQYLVSIPAVEWVDADGNPGPLDGYSSSTGDEQQTLDGNDNGIDPANHGEDVWSGTVILGNNEPLGEDPSNDNITPDAQSDLTIDFGFYYNFDLALKKQLITEADIIEPGDDITYRITIYNQGEVDAFAIDVMDHSPAELIYKSSNAAAVTTTEAGAAVVLTDNGTNADGLMSFTIDTLAAGDSVAIDVTFNIDFEFEGDSIVNLAEITDADDDEDPDNDPPVDIDSVPDTDPDNDGDPKDDETDENGKDGGDEDDHDPEEVPLRIPLFDLALDKKLTPGQSNFVPGGEVQFDITIYNQGQKDAFRIGVTDHPPAGLTYKSSNAAAVTTTEDGNAVAITDDGNNSFTIDALQVNDAVTITVTMTIGDNVTGELVNLAEIDEADDDDNPDDAPPVDVDSTPDGDPNNDGDPKDDVIDENGKDGGDEDDHDPAVISVIPLAEIGDTVWYDNNYDGLQTAGEPGVEGVTVNLYDEDDKLVGTTKTDANGKYIFTDLIPGVYSIEFDINTLPANFVPTSHNSGSDDAADSDGDPNTGKTIRTTLDAGESDMTWDFGIYQPAGLGDYVWFDLDADGIQDDGETPIENVTVRLLDPSGSVLGTTVTNAEGYYEFRGLRPGDYVVEFVPPAGFGFTMHHEGLDTAKDSDADRATGRSEVVNLSAGEFDPTIDAGLASGSVLAAIEEAIAARTAPPTPTPTPVPAPTATPVPFQAQAQSLTAPAITKVGDRSVATIGDVVTYTINATNTNNAVLTGAVVTDVLDSRLDYVSATASRGNVGYDASTRTVRIDLGDMAAGETIAITLTVRINNTAAAPDRIDNVADVIASNAAGARSTPASVQLIPNQIPTTGLYGAEPGAYAAYAVVFALLLANLATVIVKRKEELAG